MTPLDYPTKETSLLEYLFLTAALIGMFVYALWLAGKGERNEN